MQKEENFITKLNYSEKAKGLLAMSMFGILAVAAKFFEYGPTKAVLPPWMVGRMFDAFTVPVFVPAFKAYLGENEPPLTYEVISALFYGFSRELLQKTSIPFRGTYDPGDFVAMSIGVPIWLAYDGSAKILYKSGITKPIYKALGIQDRRNK